MNSSLDGIDSRELDAAFAGLSHGLHALAQPLTILRGRLDPDRVDRMNAAQLRQMVVGSGEQVEQICSLFHYLQQLVDTATSPPVLAQMPTGALLTSVFEGVNLPIREAGMSLLNEVPPGCEAVMVDRHRALQALSSILLVLFRLSSSPDVIEMAAVSMPEAVRIVIRNDNCFQDNLGAHVQLTLALAETCLRSQGGSYVLTLKPFAAIVDLPKAPPATPEAS